MSLLVSIMFLWYMVMEDRIDMIMRSYAVGKFDMHGVKNAEDVRKLIESRRSASVSTKMRMRLLHARKKKHKIHAH